MLYSLHTQEKKELSIIAVAKLRKAKLKEKVREEKKKKKTKENNGEICTIMFGSYDWYCSPFCATEIVSVSF